jgi:D-alanyl-D-alanine carboxypeptidase
MQSYRIILAACLLLTLACQPASEPTVEPQLQALIDAAVSDNESIHGVALHVDSPLLGLDWEGGSGMADPARGTPMTADRPVRLASNAKTFIAAAVLRLWEEGELDLDDPIAAHLSTEHTDMLRGDGYDTDAITVRHLLTHTSGIFDHTGPPVYVESILSDPQHRWTRTEQVTGAVEWGDPHAPPGEIYTYCDTGYILLGEVVERAAERPMGLAVRDLVGYSNLGMDSTWWEILEGPPVGVPDRAHQFLDDLDVTGFDPSYDLYGGGGVVSTVGDLARFWRGLFSTGVFERAETLDTMLTTIDGARALADASSRALPPGAYRMGVWEIEVEGYATYRHTGFWGTLATYVPELDLVVTLTVNQNQCGTVMDDLAREAIRIVSVLRRASRARGAFEKVSKST